MKSIDPEDSQLIWQDIHSLRLRIIELEKALLKHRILTEMVKEEGKEK